LNIQELREQTGCGMMMCKQAFDYAKGDDRRAIAYLKAKTYAVSTPKLTFDERVKLFFDNEPPR